MSVIVRRLTPGSDLRQQLELLASEHTMMAGVVMSLVGSLRQVSLRFADSEEATTLLGPFEIVSATGTVSTAGLHVHIAVSDKHGRTIGGHLMPGSIVFTTCEAVMLNLSAEWHFNREVDKTTGYAELKELRASQFRREQEKKA